MLTGFAGYVVADQGDPNEATGAMVNMVSNFVILPAAVLTSRLVKDAKKKHTVRADSLIDESAVRNPGL